jgi:capsular exopolysaccharide synthesis family protein
LQKLNRKIKVYQNKIRSKVQAQLNKKGQIISMTGLYGNKTVMDDIYNLQKKIINLKVQRQQYQLQNDIQVKELHKLNAAFNNLPKNIIMLARLKRKKKAKEQFFLTVNKMQTRQLLKKKTQFGRGQIINRSSVPGMPVAPDKRAYLLIGFIIGCLLGAGFVIVRDAFDNTIDSSILHKKFNENVPDIPLLAVIPELKRYLAKGQQIGNMTGQSGKRLVNSLIVHTKSTSPAAEAFRRLETSITHLNPDAPLKMLNITSSVKGEGKTTIAANLAITMAESGKNILLIDGDFHRPKLHRIFGRSRKPGITEILFDHYSLDEVIHPTSIPDLYLLTSGSKPSNPSAILKSDKLHNLITEVKQRYEYVILDSAPIGSMDSSIFVEQADGTLITCRFRKTQRGDLNRTIYWLNMMDANILGTVLNGYKADKGTDYYYGTSYYNAYYSDYYEET